MSKQKRNQGRMNDATYSTSFLLFIFMFSFKSQFFRVAEREKGGEGEAKAEGGEVAWERSPLWRKMKEPEAASTEQQQQDQVGWG